MALGCPGSLKINQMPRGAGLHDPKLQKLGSQSMQGQNGLLDRRLDRDKAVIGLTSRRPDGLRIGRIGLVAQDKGRYVSGGNIEPHARG